ncbi:hypothetical protein J2Z32_002136 [Paenibacillus turicensis]|uniref:Phage tail tape measure protein n=1 Tax=Paenibacillus turicensis TaxID=160487 RepID=A0ABS4FSI4_9BACL|nr:hypothetical protein [Paenibacillus turicensis]MBP1905506.1 hypothetical protein [Paenibacillus turicensis]
MTNISDAVDVGAIRAKIEVDLSAYNSGMESAKAKAQELGVAGKKAATDMAAIGDTGEKIGQLTKTLDNINQKIEIQKRKMAELKMSIASTFDSAKKSKLQEQLVNTEANMLRLIQASDNTAARLAALEDSTKQAGNQFASFNGKLKEIGLSADQVSRVGKALGEVNAKPTETQIKAVREELVRLGASADQIEKVERELKETEKQADKTKQGMAGLNSALTSLGAGFAAKSIVDTVTSLADEANKLQMSYSGVTAVSKALNVDVSESIGLVEELSNRWGLNQTTLAETVKTYLSAGLTLKETKDLIIATADAAAYNRQAHLSWDEAILQTARGIKQGNSELTDAAGITTNLSVMYDRYAKTLGTTAGKLTEAGKVQAAYNGMINESAMFVGNADEAMAGYTGVQATFTNTIKQARAEIGGAFVPALQEVLELITPLIKNTADWASQNKEVIAGTAAAGLAITSLISVVGALSAAFVVLNSAMGGIGVVLTLLGAVAAGVLAYGAAADSASGSVLRLANSQGELNAKMKDAANWTSTDLKNAREDIKQLEDLVAERRILQSKMDELRAKMPDMSNPQPGNPDPELTRELIEIRKGIDEIDDALRDLDFKTPEEAARAIDALKEATKNAVNATLQEQDATFAAAAANNERLKSLEASLTVYEQLNARQTLDAAQKQELRDATIALTSAYPGLNAVMDAEGRLRVTNIELAGQQIAAERDMLNATLNYEDQRLASLQRTTEAQKESIEAQIKNYEALMATMLDVISTTNSANTLQQEKNYVRSMGEVNSLYSEQNQVQASLNDIKARRAKLSSGNIPRSGGSRSEGLYDTSPAKAKKSGAKTQKSGKSAAELAAEARKKAYDADLATIRYMSDFYDWDADMQIKKYEELQKKHAKFLKESQADARTLNLQLKRLGEDSVKSRYEFSAEWITKEERRMEESGKTETEIAQMKLDAWTRVRDRHAKDSELYKRADEEVYRARKDLTTKTTKLAIDLVKTQKSSIDTVKKAEIEAIKQRKQAALADYDARIKAIDELLAKEAELNSDIDYETQLREKNARIDLLASAVGPEGIQEREDLIKERDRMILEHDRDLRKRELESQKKALTDERTIEEKKYDDKIQRTENLYDMLLTAFDGYSGDIKTIEAVLADFRVSEAARANTKILTELDAFIVQYNAKMAKVAVLQESDDLATYNSNKEAWVAAKAMGNTQEMARLNAENEALRKKYGIKTDDGKKLQSFRVGGIVQGVGDEPVVVKAHAGEMVLNDRQQAVLWDAINGGIRVQNPSNSGGDTIIHNTFDMSVGEVTLEDNADIAAMYNERRRSVERLQTQGIKTL